MKFLENSKLEAVSNALSTDSGDCRLDLRIESYSCKLVKSDKKVLTGIFKPGTSPHDLQPLSPPVYLGGPLFPAKSRRISGGSDTGDEGNGGPVLCDTINRKMLFNLTTLLNSSFPDYDFSQAKGESFSQVPDLDAAVRLVDAHLGPVSGPYPQLKAQMWTRIDEEIQLKDCLIYSYNPEFSCDPFSEDGCVWSFNFFFYNLGLKRILFLNCRATSGAQASAEEMSDDVLWEMDDED